MTAEIHPTAIVDEGVQLGAGVKIGPFCVVRAPAALADDVELKSHVVIEGVTTIGAGTVVHPFCVLGAPTPDLKYRGEASRLVIGARNIIREYVTMHPGTAIDRMETTIGDDNLIMERVHVGHDTVVGSRCIIVNSVGISGHVVVEDNVTIGGMTGIVQRVRIGTGAFIGGYCKIERDVLPYALIRGEDSYMNGINVIGLQRRGLDEAGAKTVLRAYRRIFSGVGTLAERVDQAAIDFAGNPQVEQMVAFIRAKGASGLTMPLEKTLPTVDAD